MRPLWFLATLLQLAVCSGPKLSLPRALLPLRGPAQPPAELLLTVTGSSGCYLWSSSRDDVVEIVRTSPVGSCSATARILSSTRVTDRRTAIVFAEDRDTRQVLRCDIIIDRIAMLKIVTTTREIFVEEAPEAFEVRAYDDQGNEFTSLDGLEFSWTVESSLKKGDVIRVIKFAESPYKASSALQDLEARGFRGNTVLLEGVSTGSAKVTARLIQPEYSSVNSAEVTLRVVANLLVMPSDVAVMLHDSVNFKIIQVREGRLTEIPQPSIQYWLDIENSTVADLNLKTGVAVGKALGTTRILLKDAGEGADEDGDSVRSPEALLRVVVPYSLRIEVLPAPTSRLWNFQCGDDIVVIVLILDKENRQIHVGSETRVSVEFDESLLTVYWRSLNGTISNGIAQYPGVVPITATLLSVAGKPIKPKITANAEITIFKRIEVIPPEVFLPWDALYHSRSEIQLQAVGGDGFYFWHGEGAAKVDSRGLVTALTVGNATITASMPSNSRIYGTASVQVLEPISLEVVWYEEEGAVGSSLPIHVGLFTELSINSGIRVPYANCDLANFKITSIEGIDFDVIDYDETKERDEPRGSACTVLNVKCKEAGNGLIGIRWGQLEVGLSLGCYTPLQRLYPSPSQAAVILTVGSSLNVIFTGGPVSLFSGEIDARRETTVLNPDIVKTAPFLTENSLHVYTITCLEIGDTTVNLKIFIGENEFDPSRSRTAEAFVDVQCSNPYSLKLSLRNNVGPSCPIALSSQMMVVSGGGPVEVEVTVLDIHGQKFHNASSLRARWSAKPTVILPDLPLEKLLTRLDHQYNVPTVNYHYQTLSVFGNELTKSGTGEITLETIGLRAGVLKNAGIRHTPTLPTLPQATLPLRLIAPVQTPSNKILIFNHPSGIVRVPLIHGSSYFQVSTSKSGIARVSLDKSTERTVSIQPLADGDITVSINDLCIHIPPTVLQASPHRFLRDNFKVLVLLGTRDLFSLQLYTDFFEVSVVSIANIIADIPELIEKGRSVQCLVRFFDRAGNVLLASIDGAPSLVSRVIEGNINVQATAEDTIDDAILYTVTGLDIGDALIEFTAGSARGTAHTYIFAPLQLVPQTSVILPGGSLKLGVIGGPPPPATLRFSKNSGPSDVVEISKNGVILGVGMGKVGVEACADGFRGAEYVCASASVRVLPLEGVTIQAPTSTLLTGNTMPVWATGTPDNLGPMELGALKPSLRFRWSLSGDGVVSITDVLGTTGIEFDDTDRVSTRLKAILPGVVTIHLNVTALPGSVIAQTCGYTWYAKLDLVIIEPLQMITPPVKSSYLLLAPNSAINLETNYKFENVVYSLMEDADKSSGSGPLAKITSDGKLTTFGRLGFGVLLVSTIDSQLSKQHISITIEVCAPHYAMAELVEEYAWNKLSGLGMLPSGLTLPLILSKFDYLGRKLTISTEKIRFLTNRPDLLYTASNSSKIQEVYVAESGHAVMKLWDAKSEKQFTDYLSIKINHAIYPQKILATVGDVWCMRSAVHGGVWIENMRGTVWTGPSGIAQAHISNVAATSLIYQPPNGLPYLTQASVITRPADMIYFLEPEKSHVVTDEKPYSVYLVLGNHEEQNKYNNLIFEERDCLIDDLEILPFTCEIKLSIDILTPHIIVTPVFNKIKGTYGCQLTWSPDSSTLLPSNDSVGITLIARTGGVSTEPLFLRLIRAAIVQPEIVVLSPPPASLAPLDVTGSLEVLRQIQVVADGEILSVEGPMHLSDTVARYIVRAKTNSAGAQKSHILFVSPLTHQSSEIMVSLNNGYGPNGPCITGGGSTIIEILQKYQPILLAIVCMAVILAVTIYVYGNFFYPLRMKSSNTSNMTPSHDISSNIRNMSYQSRSPLSLSGSGASPSSLHSSSMHQSPPSPGLDASNSTIYGDPSYLSVERRRNRRFI